jgi:hypothetical protein
LAPDAAVDEVEVMEEFHGFVDGIGIATDLEFDMFCDGIHWDFLLCLWVKKIPKKIAAPFTCSAKQGGFRC